jgi:Flp pilus assembly protein TadD
MMMSRFRRASALVASVVVAAALQFGAGCASSGGAQRSSPQAYAARTILARELVSRGDWARAFAMLEELHRDQPDDADVLILRGIVYRERGLFADAEADLKAALKIVPNAAEAHAALGIVYDVQTRPEAEAAHRQAVKLAPNNAVFLNNLGFSLYLRHRFKEAINMYEQAARLAPSSRRVRTNLGFACAAIGDLPRAAREFQMGGTEAEAKNNLGFAYERRGDMANAYELYVQAVRLDPKIDRARSNLVHAAIVLGRPVPPEASAPAAGTPSLKAADDGAGPETKIVPADAPKKEAQP